MSGEYQSDLLKSFYEALITKKKGNITVNVDNISQALLNVSNKTSLA
jgi:hypothetical protein